MTPEDPFEDAAVTRLAPVDDWIEAEAGPLLDQFGGPLLAAAYGVGGWLMRRYAGEPEQAFALLDDYADLLADAFLLGTLYTHMEDPHDRPH